MDKQLHLTAHIPLTVRLIPELYQWIRSEAALHHVTLAKVVSDHLSAQRDLRRQLASSLEVHPDGAGPLIHVLLERTKMELARTLDAQTAEIAAVRKQLSRVLEQLHQALVMLDRAFYAYLLHTPTVNEADQSRARAEALRRYEKWIADVRAQTFAPRPQPQQEDGHGHPFPAPAAAGAPTGKTPA
jgi:hypothetical protein